MSHTNWRIRQVFLVPPNVNQSKKSKSPKKSSNQVPRNASPVTCNASQVPCNSSSSQNYLNIYGSTEGLLSILNLSNEEQKSLLQKFNVSLNSLEYISFEQLMLNGIDFLATNYFHLFKSFQFCKEFERTHIGNLLC